MIFAVYCVDGPDSAQARERALAAHSQRLRQAGFALLAYGPLTADGEPPAIGSLFVVDAPSRSDVVAFFMADPLRVEGAWRSVDVHAFAPSRNSLVRLVEPVDAGRP